MATTDYKKLIKDLQDRLNTGQFKSPAEMRAANDMIAKWQSQISPAPASTSPAPVQQQAPTAGTDPNQQIMVRPYLVNRYGVKDNDIGWKPTANGGNMVTLGGYDFMEIAPENLKDNRSYATVGDFDKAMQAFKGKTGYDFAANSNPATRNYTPGNTDQINALLDEILAYPEFQFDMNTDPLAQSVLQQAEKSGKTAYTNSLAELSAMTGGRPNSWAASVAGASQRAIMDEANAQLPALYNAAYDRWRQGRADKLGNINLLTGLDDREYNRFYDERNFDYGVGRDERADFETDRQYDRDVFTSDRAYNEGVRQFDQNFGENVRQFEKNYDRGVFESDRSFDEGVRQYDKSFDEGVRQYDRNYSLQKDEFDYRKQQDTQRTAEDAPVTAGQLAAYNQIRDTLLNNYSQADALRLLDQRGRTYYTDMMGDKLYNQLLADLQGGYQQAEPETMGAIYEAMMNDPDPEAWLKENAAYMDDEEIKQAVKWLPKEQQMELLREILGG